MKSDESRLVEAARQGDLRAMEAIIARHQRRLLGYILKRVHNRYDAEDILQITLEKVFLHLYTLKNPESFVGWLLRICDNVISTHFRTTGTTDSLPECLPDPFSVGEYESLDNRIRISIGLLKSDLRDVVQLRYYAGLSYREMAGVLRISESRVKSRLFEARKKLKDHLSSSVDGLCILPQKLYRIKEKIMEDLGNIKLGSHILTRLSLADQVAVCECVQKNEEFGLPLLEEIGRIRRGKEFIKVFHSRLLFNELISILNFCDSATEKRLILELQEVNPDLSETIKQNMFVFEDTFLLDEEVIRVLFRRIDRKVLINAMSGTSSMVKEHLLSIFGSDEREALIAEIGHADASPETVAESQLAAINLLRDMDRAGEIEIKRLPDLPEPSVRILLKNRR